MPETLTQISINGTIHFCAIHTQQYLNYNRSSYRIDSKKGVRCLTTISLQDTLRSYKCMPPYSSSTIGALWPPMSTLLSKSAWTLQNIWFLWKPASPLQLSQPYRPLEPIVLILCNLYSKAIVASNKSFPFRTGSQDWSMWCHWGSPVVTCPSKSFKTIHFQMWSFINAALWQWITVYIDFFWSFSSATREY